MSKVLVDTSIWSEVLRRRKNTNLQIHQLLKELIEDGRAYLIGPIRQEILSGIKEESQFNKLKDALTSFDDHYIDLEVYEIAAKFNNLCRSKGIQGSHIDFLICAVAYYNHMSIFTADEDFKRYSKYLDIKLFNKKTKQ